MAKSSIEVYGAESEQKLLRIDPDKLVLVEDPNHPLYDERVHLPIDEEMVQSIMAHGVRSAAEIRKNPKNGDIEVVFGRQRVKNCREANRRLREAGKMALTVPCVPSKGTDEATLFGISVIENEHRRPDTAAGRAEKARRLLDLGKSEDQVAMYFKCSPSTVKNMVAFLDAHPKVKKAAEDGRIVQSVAYTLARLTPDVQVERLEQILAEAPRVPGDRKAKAGQGQRAKDIAAGAEAKPRLRPVKDVLALREQLLSTDSGSVLDVIDWLLGSTTVVPVPRLRELAQADARIGEEPVVIVEMDAAGDVTDETQAAQ